MAKINANSLLQGAVSGVTFTKNGEQVFSINQREIIDVSKKIEVFYKGTKIATHGCVVIAPEEIKCALDRAHPYSPVDRLVDYLDYLVNEDTQYSLYTQDGSIRIRWFQNILSRIEEDTSRLEVSRRMEFICKHMDTLRVTKGAENSYVQAALSHLGRDYSGKWVYKNNIMERYEYVSCVMPDGSIKNGLFPKKGIKIWGGTRYFIPEEDSSGSFVEVSGEKIPVTIFNSMKSRGEIFVCPDCKQPRWYKEKLMDSCTKCCGFTREQLELQAYSTRAEQVFQFKIHSSNKKLKEEVKFMGVELEYECDGDVTHGSYYALKHLKNHVIVKRDGSLDNGLEIVTAPADIYCHKEEFQKFFASFDKSNLTPQSNTGMHVHVDKGSPVVDENGKTTSFTKMGYLTLGKLSKFLQDSANASFITKIAGRSSPQYAKLSTNDKISSPFLDQGRDRYKGLNLTNSKTIEFRIFSTPKDYDTFCKNIEFCDAVTDFCAPGNSSMKDLTEAAFCAFVKSHAKAYPYLNKFLHPSKKPSVV